MFGQHVQQITLAVLALLCRMCESEVADAGACAQIANMTCSLQNVSVDYSLNISSTTYHESQLLSITISRNSCPNFDEYLGFREDTTKLSWKYTITATSSSAQAHVGYFRVPSGSRMEIESCNNSKILLFSTCEASPVDLPRTYDWIAPPASAGTICFKAVIHPPSGGCETIERCINPLAGYIAPPDDLETSGDGELGSGLPSLNNECNARWNCSSHTARQKPLCGNDGVLYPNRCYKKLAECLKRTIITTHPARGPCRASRKWIYITTQQTHGN